MIEALSKLVADELSMATCASAPKSHYRFTPYMAFSDILPPWVPPHHRNGHMGGSLSQVQLSTYEGVDVAEAIYATLHTSAGPIKVELFPNHAPKTVKNFVELAEGTRSYTDPRTGEQGSGPYYDGTIFHRVIDNFMIQGGDPTGTGRGGPGYTFGDEIHPELSFDRPYLLAMANAGPGTNGSQFFITTAPTTWLNTKHTIFGRVADPASEKIVDAIGTTATRSDRPVADIVLERVEISRVGG